MLIQIADGNQQALVEYIKSANSLILDGRPNFEVYRGSESLSFIKKSKSEAYLISTLSALISNFTNSINLTRNLNASQIIEISVTIMEKYYYFKIEDLIAFFQMCKTGLLGSFYEGIDIIKVFDKLSQFESIRMGYFSACHDKYKEPHDANRLSCEIAVADALKLAKFRYQNDMERKNRKQKNFKR